MILKSGSGSLPGLGGSQNRTDWLSLSGIITGRIRQYYPDFLAKMVDGSYELIEVKGDNKIDDSVVKAKQTAAEEMAVASGIRYIMYPGSVIMNSLILDDLPSHQASLI